MSFERIRSGFIFGYVADPNSSAEKRSWVWDEVPDWENGANDTYARKIKDGFDIVDSYLYGGGIPYRNTKPPQWTAHREQRIVTGAHGGWFRVLGDETEAFGRNQLWGTVGFGPGAEHLRYEPPFGSVAAIGTLNLYTHRKGSESLVFQVDAAPAGEGVFFFVGAEGSGVSYGDYSPGPGGIGIIYTPGEPNPNYRYWTGWTWISLGNVGTPSIPSPQLSNELQIANDSVIAIYDNELIWRFLGHLLINPSARLSPAGWPDLVNAGWLGGFGTAASIVGFEPGSLDELVTHKMWLKHKGMTLFDQYRQRSQYLNIKAVASDRHTAMENHFAEEKVFCGISVYYGGVIGTSDDTIWNAGKFENFMVYLDNHIRIEELCPGYTVQAGIKFGVANEDGVCIINLQEQRCPIGKFRVFNRSGLLVGEYELDNGAFGGDIYRWTGPCDPFGALLCTGTEFETETNPEPLVERTEEGLLYYRRFDDGLPLGDDWTIESGDFVVENGKLAIFAIPVEEDQTIGVSIARLTGLAARNEQVLQMKGRASPAGTNSWARLFNIPKFVPNKEQIPAWTTRFNLVRSVDASNTIVYLWMDKSGTEETSSIGRFDGVNCGVILPEDALDISTCFDGPGLDEGWEPETSDEPGDTSVVDGELVFQIDPVNGAYAYRDVMHVDPVDFSLKSLVVSLSTLASELGENARVGVYLYVNPEDSEDDVDLQFYVEGGVKKVYFNGTILNVDWEVNRHWRIRRLANNWVVQSSPDPEFRDTFYAHWSDDFSAYWEPQLFRISKTDDIFSVTGANSSNLAPFGSFTYPHIKIIGQYTPMTTKAQVKNGFQEAWHYSEDGFYALARGTDTFLDDIDGHVAIGAYGGMGPEGGKIVEIDEIAVFLDNKITVENLPTGWKAGLNSLIVAETDGVAEIDLKYFQCPLPYLELYDDEDRLMLRVQPENGIWGGDKFRVVVAPTEPIEDKQPEFELVKLVEGFLYESDFENDEALPEDFEILGPEEWDLHEGALRHFRPANADTENYQYTAIALRNLIPGDSTAVVLECLMSFQSDAADYRANIEDIMKWYERAFLITSTVPEGVNPDLLRSTFPMVHGGLSAVDFIEFSYCPWSEWLAGNFDQYGDYYTETFTYPSEVPVSGEQIRFKMVAEHDYHAAYGPLNKNDGIIPDSIEDPYTSEIRDYNYNEIGQGVNIAGLPPFFNTLIILSRRDDFDFSVDWRIHKIRLYRGNQVKLNGIPYGFTVKFLDKEVVSLGQEIPIFLDLTYLYIEDIKDSPIEVYNRKGELVTTWLGPVYGGDEFCIKIAELDPPDVEVIPCPPSGVRLIWSPPYIPES